MKEQLVEMTGLSPRVIRVWFQNKRCKHNKKTNAMKLQMEQDKVSLDVINLKIKSLEDCFLFMYIYELVFIIIKN